MKSFLFNEKLIFLFLLLVYLLTLIFFPFELDESSFILTGKMILSGTLDSLNPNYKNPFTYQFGSPLVPIIYGAFYIIGGHYLVRILTSIFVLLSLIIIYKLTKKIFDDKSAKIALILAGISNTTVLLAINALLDSVGIFFFILSLYFIHEKKYFWTGISLSLSFLCKFFMILPVVVLIVYFWKKRMNFSSILIGGLIIFIPFLIIYLDVFLELFNYLIKQTYFIDTQTNVKFLFFTLFSTLPIQFLIVLLNVKNRIFKDNFILVIPFFVVLVFHILTLNFMSLNHHMAYGLIPLSVLAGKIFSKYKNQSFILLIIILLNLSTIIGRIFYYPSYSLITDDVKCLDGKMLAENANIIHLLRDTDLNDDYVYNFYYFDFDNDGESTKKDYEEALSKDFFDYAIIPSNFFWNINIKEKLILVDEYYCTNYTLSQMQNYAIIYTPC